MKPVDSFILGLPPMYQNIVLHLLQVIQRELPEAEVLFKWGIPFVYLKQKPFCYVLPNVKTKYVDLGFVKGFMLKKNLDVLEVKSRKNVRSLRYLSLEAIDHSVLVDVLKEASELQ